MEYISPLFWPASIKSGVLCVLDETMLPRKLRYIQVGDVKGSVRVIRTMKTRAFGQFLVVLYTFLLEVGRKKDVLNHLQKVAHQLNNARPTFPFSEVTSVVLSVAHGAAANGADVETAVRKTVLGYAEGIRARRIKRVRALADAVNDGDRILTHCNVSGELAMALSIAQSKGKNVKVFATETRPYFQGSKLTVWELEQAMVHVTLVADNAAASLMASGQVNKVVLGSDRYAANGDVANKIGSYQIALAAKEFSVPVIVLTQPSSKVKTGAEIPIEWREAGEWLLFNGKHVFDKKAKGLYPGFDIVPHRLIYKEIAINAGL